MDRRTDHVGGALLQAVTETYLSEEGTLAQWVEECCVTGKERWGIGALLWESWQKWCDSNNERPAPARVSPMRWPRTCYPKDMSQGVRGYAGIDLKQGGHRADLA